PSASTVYAPAVSVGAARMAASSPIRRMTSLVTPRASTACPPGRSPGARSTTVTPAPRCSPPPPAPWYCSQRPQLTRPDHCPDRTVAYGAGRPVNGGSGSPFTGTPAGVPAGIRREILPGRRGLNLDHHVLLSSQS